MATTPIRFGETIQEHRFAEGRCTGLNVAAFEGAHPDLIGQYATNDAFLTAYIQHYNSPGHFLA